MNESRRASQPTNGGIAPAEQVDAFCATAEAAPGALKEHSGIIGAR